MATPRQNLGTFGEVQVAKQCSYSVMAKSDGTANSPELALSMQAFSFASTLSKSVL
jgi:hypothetical protein